MERAADRDHLVLRDQSLGLGPPLLRIALMVGENQLDLGAAKARKPGALCRGQIQIMGIVDDVCRGFQRMARTRADLRGRPRQRPDAADQDFLAHLRQGAGSESSGN